MSGILEDFSPQALSYAIEANLWEFCARLGQSPHVELHSDSEMTWYVTGVPHPMFNGVFRTQIAAGAVDQRIEAILSHFKSRKLPMMWWVGPSTRPDGLEIHLKGHGFRFVEDMPGMAVDSCVPPQDVPVVPGLTIELVEDTEALADWLHAFSAGFDLGDRAARSLRDILVSVGLGQNVPLQHYVATIRGAPVGCSSLCLGAGVAGIYNVATVPEARGRSIGAALTLKPLQMARNMGYRISIGHSSRMGFNLYERLGYRTYCGMRTWLWMPPPRA